MRSAPIGDSLYEARVWLLDRARLCIFVAFCFQFCVCFEGWGGEGWGASWYTHTNNLKFLFLKKGLTDDSDQSNSPKCLQFFMADGQNLPIFTVEVEIVTIWTTFDSTRILNVELIQVAVGSHERRWVGRLLPRVCYFLDWKWNGLVSRLLTC